MKGLQNEQDLDRLSTVTREAGPRSQSKFTNKARTIKSTYTKSQMRNKPQMLKSVFDEGSVKTNDIVSKIREFNKIKEKLEAQ